MNKLVYKPGKHKKFELDKRFYMPGYVLKSTCPNCNKRFEMDFATNYLSYPVVGNPASVYCYCENGCGTEWEVKVVVRVTLNLV